MPRGGLGTARRARARLAEDARYGEVGVPAELVGERREGAAGGGQRAFLVQEVVEDQDLAAGPADAGHLGDHPLGLGHDRDEVHGDHGVEARVGEVERARVHPAEGDDLGEAEGGDPGLGPCASISALKSMPVTSRCGA